MWLSDKEYNQIIRIARIEFNRHPGWEVNTGWAKDFKSDFVPMTKEDMIKYFGFGGAPIMTLSDKNIVIKKKIKYFTNTTLILYPCTDISAYVLRLEQT